MNTLLDIQYISYTIGTKDLIQDLCFSIHTDEIVSIIGYNWSGKSTLLKLLLGSIHPTSWSIKKSEWVQLWYVPQKLSFVHDLPLTVRDFVQIYNQNIVQGYTPSCSFLDIQDLWDTPLTWLSGGQLQKILIYNALLWKPDILLLDEPTAWLDIIAQQEFYTLVEHVHQEHKVSIVLVSHDIHTVYSRSDQIICLHQGACCAWSPNDKSFSQEVNKLLGWYIIPYLHTHDHHSHDW